MATEKSLLVKIGANIDNFEKGMSKVQKQMNDVQNKFQKIGDKVSGVGKKLTTSVTLPIVAIGAASAKMAGDFSTSFAKVTTIADTSVKSVGTIKKEVMDFSNKTGVAASQVNEALYQCISAGVDTADAMDVLNVANKAAKGGFSDINTAIDGVTSVLNAYGLESKEAENVANSMLVAQNKGKTTFDELAKSLYNVLPTAASVNVGIDQVTSSLAAMTAQGTPTSVATTQLRQAFVELDKEGSKAQKTFEKIAGKSFKDFISEGGNVADAMKLMDDHAKSNGISIKDLFGSVEAGNAAMQLTSEKGAKVFNDALKEMETNTTALDDAFKKMDDTPMAKIEKSVNRVKNAMIDAGSIILPIVADIAEFIAKLADKFSNLDPKAQNVILAFAGIAAIAGPLISIIGSILGVVGSCIAIFQALSTAATIAGVSVGVMCAPFAIAIGVILAVIAAGVALYLNWDTIKEKAQALGENISETWNSIKEWTSTTWDNIKTAISEKWNEVKENISTGIENIKETFTQGWENVKQWTSEAWEYLKEIISVGMQFIGDLIKLGFDIITLPFRFIWENCKESLIEIWTNITSWLSDTWNDISNKLKSFFEPMSTFISDTWNNVKQWTSDTWSTVSNYLSEKWNEIKSSATEKFNSIKTAISDKWNEVKSNATEKWNTIKSDLSNKWNEIKSNASDKFGGIKSSISTKWDSMKSDASTTWNNVKSNISETWNGIKKVVSDGVEKLKSFVDFKWELPKLKMPHFSISGKFSLNPPSAPKFGIDWYHTGGIFRKPTVLGDGRGVGDAVNGIGSAPEAILPIKELPSLLGLDKQENTEHSGDLVIDIDGREVFRVMSPYMGRAARGM